MAMEVDVKRVNINLENLKVQYDNVLAMQEQQLNLLKYIMDYPAEEQITLVPVNSENITPVELTGLSEICTNSNCCNRKGSWLKAEKDDWPRLYSFIKPDRQLDVLRLYGQRPTAGSIPDRPTIGSRSYGLKRTLTRSYIRRTG